MSEDKYYQRAEYLVSKGYLPKMDIFKIADILKQRDQANVQSTVFVNTRETVYGENAEEIKKRINNTPPEKQELLNELDRVNARANGNITPIKPVTTTIKE